MHIVIIGNGISGITAARQLRKLDSNTEITVISGESKYFFSRTALMYIYMGHMRFEDTKPYEDWFWEKNRITLVQDWVQTIDWNNKTLSLQDRGTLPYDQLIIATGSSPRKFDWPGQDLKAVQGLYSLQDLDSMEAYSDARLKRAVIVGGGLIGIEMAEMFHARKISVTFLVREESYWNRVLPKEESEMLNRHILEHGIDLRLGEELKEIIGDETGRASAAITRKGEPISCQFVGLSVGVAPNIDFLRNTGLEINQGILVDQYLKTNIDGVYAIGDCAELRSPKAGRRPIEAIWYTGRMMGETVAYNVLTASKQAYDPGIWFNSAKFFDIEYQVYGQVPTKLPEGYKSLYWEHKKGKKSIRINYEQSTKAVTGFNLMGIRYRQEVCEKWIREKTSIEEVLQQLSIANFDPEFFKSYEKELIALYNQRAEQPIQLKQKRSLSAALNFLKRRK